MCEPRPKIRSLSCRGRQQVCEVSATCDAWSNCSPRASLYASQIQNLHALCKRSGSKVQTAAPLSIGFTHPPPSLQQNPTAPSSPAAAEPRGIVGEYSRWPQGAPDVWVGSARLRGPLCEVWGSVWTNSFAPWDKAEKRSATLPPLPLNPLHQ